MTPNRNPKAIGHLRYVFLASTAVSAFASQAQAQFPANDPGGRGAVYINDVDANTGALSMTEADLVLGDAGSPHQMVFSRSIVPQDFVIAGELDYPDMGAFTSNFRAVFHCRTGFNTAQNTSCISSSTSSIVPSKVAIITIGTDMFQFSVQNGAFVSNVYSDGATLDELTDRYVFRDKAGTEYTFPRVSANYCGQAHCILASKSTVATGQTVNYTYETAYQDTSSGYPSHKRLKTATNNLGQGFSLGYLAAAGGTEPGAGGMTTDFIKKKTISSVAAVGWNCSVSVPCTAVVQPSVSYSYAPQANTTVPYSSPFPHLQLNQASLSSGRTRTFTWNQGSLLTATWAGASPKLTNAYTARKVVSQTTADGRLWQFQRTKDANGQTTQTRIIDPEGGQTTYAFTPYRLSPDTVIDAVGRQTSFVYDGIGRLIQSTTPSGVTTAYVYDTRGNITQTTLTASGGGQQVSTASFDACTATNFRFCNSPNAVTDARGNTLNYTYDIASGGVATITQPAASGGSVRPQTRLSYTLTGGGYRPFRVSTCRLTASCDGTADEIASTLSYDASTGSLVSETSGSGDNALLATTSYRHDNLGNRVATDGPLPGSADTSVTRYDLNRRVIGVAGPAPTSGQPSRAVAYSYDADGAVLLEKTGTVANQTDAAWTGFSETQTSTSTYDVMGRVTRQSLTASGGTLAISDYRYDGVGRQTCSIAYMDLGNVPSQSTNCGPHQINGALGPDRVEKTIYDLAGQVSKQQAGVGTPDQIDEVSLTYHSSGQVDTMTDANGNRTTFEYDGFDRISKTRLPNGVKGSAISSTTDFEQFTYDANGNVLSRRLRDGQTIGFTFDAINRLITKTPPAPEGAISYSYDLLGRVLSVARPSDGVTSSFTHDALNRMTSETQVFGSTAWQFDLAGRRIRTTWADGFFVNYDYDVTGNITAVRENGGTANQYTLATYGYDSLGRRISTSRGGASASYGYDAASRLSNLSLNFAEYNRQLTVAPIVYNAASQIVALTRSNDDYVWTGHYNVNRPYASNGLNQYSSAGSTAFSFDARGNLTSSGTSSYSYTAENRLKTASSGVAAYYDGLGRLAEYSVSTSTRFTYDGAQISSEVANPTGSVMRRYVWLPGTDELVVWYEGAGVTDRRFAHQDERGSVVAWSNTFGSILNINRYDANGIPSDGNIGRFQYTGQAWFSELGMYSYKARVYSPTLGRFLQTDPIGYGDGMNLYSYVGNDPVNRNDPTGLACVGFGCGNNEVLTAKRKCGFFCSIGRLFGGGSGSGPSNASLVNPIPRAGSAPPPLSLPRIGTTATSQAAVSLSEAQTLKQTICGFASKIGSGDRVRLGGDAAAGIYGYFRAGLGLSVANDGSVFFDGYLGGGPGFALSGALGPSYQFNAPTTSQVTFTGNLGAGVGPAGGMYQAGLDSNFKTFLGGSINVGYPTPPIPTGKYGGEAGFTMNAESAVKIYDPRC